MPLLIRELWDDVPPNSKITTLQTYILNLRRLFASATGLPATVIARDLLITRANGYQLETAGVGTLDADAYYALVDSGMRELSAGNDRAGARQLNNALRLWRGPALVDVPAGRVLESKRRQLEESRLVVLEYLVDAEIRLGMYREVLTELAALTVENPYHEGLHAQYMWALQLSGRRAQALEVFHQLRGTLVSELGLDPGHRLQRLYQAILTSDEFDAQMRHDRPAADVTRWAATTGNARNRESWLPDAGLPRFAGMRTYGG